MSKDVEYSVSTSSIKEKIFKNFDKAAAYAVNIAIGGGEATLDVLVYSRAGAKSIGGESAAEQYDEDPEASVFERFEIKVNSVGRVP